MAEKDAPQFIARFNPFPLELGTTYAGSTIDGSFQIYGATDLIETENLTDQTIITTDGPHKSLKGLVWKFKLLPNAPGCYFQVARFVLSDGKLHLQANIEILEGKAPGGSVFFCSSPFSAFCTSHMLANLKLLIRHLGMQINASNEFSNDLSVIDIIVLKGSGLRYLSNDGAKCLNNYLYSRKTVLLFVDAFYHKSLIMAKDFCAAYGLHFVECGKGDEVICDSAYFENHALLTGIRTLRWTSSCVVKVLEGAQMLVRSPVSPDKAFVAIGGPYQNLLVVCTSLLEDMLCVGWPFDNPRLFANLLQWRGREKGLA